MPIEGTTDSATPPVELRDILDYDTTRKNIHSSTLKTLGEVYPVENSRFRLELGDLKLEGPESYSLAEQKRAILQRKDLSHRLVGKWKLIDKGLNKPVDEKKGVVAHIPYMTPRGTFIIGGSEYTVSSQMRLRSGVYSRRKDNGELESHFNILKGGPSFHVMMEPSTGVFRLQVGQSNLKLYPILKEMGVTDKDMAKTWGNEILASNMTQREDSRTLHKVYEKLAPYRSAKETGENIPKRPLAEVFAGLQLDPEVTKRTLGKPYANVTPEVILRSTHKLLNISKDKEDVDDRDSLAYQHVLGPEDLFRDRITRDAGKIRSRMLWKSTLRGNLSGVPYGALDPQLESLFYKSGIANALEEVNMMDPLDQNTRIIRTGEGGISGENVPAESRAVQPSYFGFIDCVRSPESLGVGLDNRFAIGVRRGSDGKIYSPFIDMKSGKQTYLNPSQAVESVIAFPGEFERSKENGMKRVRAMVKGRMQYVPFKDVQYQLPTGGHMLSYTSNLVPLANSSKAGRLLMGGKYISQALPLRDNESPLVQTELPDRSGSFESHLGNFSGTVHSNKPGKVISVDNDSIKVKHSDGTVKDYELYNHFVQNRKTFLSSYPAVKVGDNVHSGQLLAHSNFTDKEGNLALGTNLRIGYMPYRGLNYEDAMVVSQEGANKLTSEHMYTSKMDTNPNRVIGRKTFLSLYPSIYTKEQLSKVDSNGVIKPGAMVTKGDPLILSVERRTHKGAGQLYRKAKSSFVDNSSTWEHDVPGYVTDVFADGAGIKVAAKMYAPAEVGDKVSNLHGGKGIIAAIIPDEEMPRDEEGRPLHIIANPQGIITRGNPSQIHQTILSKIARKTGNKYILSNFSGKDMTEFVRGEMKKHNVKDTETIFDPKMNRNIPGILVGENFYLKLHHTAASKESSRGLGGYSAEGEPAGGEDLENPKRVGFGEIAALISHGASKNINDIKNIRSQRNEDYWRSVIQGLPLPSPEIPLSYKKFLSTLQAAGVNIKKDGNNLHLLAMTDKDVDKLSSGEIKNSDTVKWFSTYGREAYGEKSMEPIEGGLFDRGITGGHGGNKFGHVVLHEPMPQPIMEDVIRGILGLTKGDIDNIVAGKKDIGGFGTGPEGLQKALSNINVKKEIESQKGIFKDATSAAKRDSAAKKLKFLSGLDRTGVKPEDLMVTKIPVLPPIFRPISATEKFTLVSGTNRLYKTMMVANDNLKETKGALTGEPVGDARLALYNSLKAVIGLGEPIKPEERSQNVKGLLSDVFGDSPKYGTYQRRLLGSTVELAGRAAISPNPALNIDQIGLPESHAWELFGPFVARRLARKFGNTPAARATAVRMVSEKKPEAVAALQEEMAYRPVMATRAPALHKYSLMAFMPVLTKEKTLQLSPPITPGFNADFDGDAMNFHVVVSDDAIKEAKEKMLASKNLRSPSDFTVNWAPRQEFLEGLYRATAHKKQEPPHPFRTQKEALAAFHRGEIDVDTPVVITG